MKINKKGFTLVEVLVVVLIIGILAAIAVPSYNFTVEKTRAKQGITSLTQIAKAQYTYNAKKGNYSDNMLNLPLEMKDANGSEVTGSKFSDSFFDYQVYGDKFERARATRSNGEYELSVDYATGELFCRPATNRVCMDLGLEEGEKFSNFDKRNIQDWTLKTYLQYIMENLDGIWDYGVCGNTLSCFEDEVKDLCSNDGEGTCLNTVNPSKYVYGADGYKYYWQTWNNFLVLEVNDYAARPFFAMVFFAGDNIYLQCNRNHSAQRCAEVAEELGVEKLWKDNGDWSYYRLRGYNQN